MRIILFFMFMVPSLLQAQKIPYNSETGKIAYTSVVNQPGTKDELYLKAKKWITTTFKSTKDVIQLDDRESGSIIIKGLTQYVVNSTYKKFNTPVDVPLFFTLSLDFKSDKYRYTFTDLYTEKLINGHITTVPAEELTQDVTQEIINEQTEELKKIPLMGKKGIEESIASLKSLSAQHKLQLDNSMLNLITSLENYMSNEKTEGDW